MVFSTMFGYHKVPKLSQEALGTLINIIKRFGHNFLGCNLSLIIHYYSDCKVKIWFLLSIWNAKFIVLGLFLMLNHCNCVQVKFFWQKKLISRKKLTIFVPRKYVLNKGVNFLKLALYEFYTIGNYSRTTVGKKVLCTLFERYDFKVSKNV